MPKPHFTVGGTVQATGGVYIPRQADEELLKLCVEGTFAYVLTSRQVGKSSLMVRTAEQLAGIGTRSVIIDLTNYGVQVSAEAWYLGLLTTIADDLSLDTDVINWWRSHSDFGATQRLTQFFQEVVLKEIPEPIVIFIDEIDSTLSLNFTDDFYAAIRFLWNARAKGAEFRRLTFVLIGVATPSDLISDPHRTPFNIGQQVNLTDFTFEEALPLAEGLCTSAERSQQVLQSIMKWTNGHPYLTQRLCRTIADERRSDWTEPEIAHAVAQAFFGRMSEEDNNLQFVRDMLTKRAPDKLRVLEAYKEIRTSRRPVRDEEQSRVKAQLKLSGIVKREEGKLRVRNPIYHEVFGPAWIKEHWPVGWWQTVPLYAKIGSGVIVVLAIAALGFGIYAFDKADENEKYAIQLKVKSDSLQSLLDNTRVLTELRDSANATALASAKFAEDRAKEATEYAEKERLARFEAEKERQRAEDQTKRANQREAEARDVGQKLQKSLSEEERRRRIDIAQKLMREATLQQQLGNADLGVLLARQAFLMNNKYGGPFENEIYQIFVKTLDGIGGPFLFVGHQYAIKAVALHPDSHFIASASEDGTVRVWNFSQSQASLMTLVGHTAGIRTIAFSPSGKILATGSDDHTVRLWELDGISYKSKILRAHGDGVWAVDFSPDGNYLASGSADKTVRLWDLRLNQSILFKTNDRVRSVAISPDGYFLAVAIDDGNIWLWDIRQTNQGPKVLRGHIARVNAVTFSSDGQVLASGSNDQTIRLWNMQNLSDSTKILRHHDGFVNTVRFSHDGQILASGSHDGNVLLWNRRKSNDTPILSLAHGTIVWSVIFNSDGRTLFAGCEDKVLRAWLTQVELIADKVCDKVKRNLSFAEWEQFIGKDIPYESTCTKLPPGK